MSKPRFYFEIDGVDVEAVDDGGVYTRAGVSVTRGYADENASLKPGLAGFTLKNHDLRYSDNPLSPNYGKFGQGTPFRVAAFRYPNTKGLWTPPSLAGGATTPDSVALSITGDIDLRAEVPLYQSDYYFVTKSLSYALRSRNGFLRFEWINASTSRWRTSTAPIPAGHTAFRATLDVDNGAAGHTVVFYTAATWGGAWVQLGAPVVTAGVTTIDNSADAAFLGGTTTAAGPLCVRQAEIRSGIGGTIVASPNPAGQADGTTSFADAQANTWTVDTDSRIGSGVSQTRFVGELSQAKHQRDTSDTDHYVLAEVSGISQRLSQGGGSRVSTALESWVPARTAASFRAEGYWPLNEGSGSVAGRSALGGADMVFTRPANPVGRFGSGDIRLPWLDTGVAMFAGDRLAGVVNMPAGSATAWEFDFIYACQDGADVTIDLRTASKKVWTIYIKPSTGEIGFSAPGGGAVLASDLDIDLFDGVGKLVMFRVYPDGGTPTTANAFIVVSTNYEGEGSFGTNDIIDDGFSIGVPLTPVNRLESFEFEHTGTPDKAFALSHVAAFSALALTSVYAIEVPAAGNILEQADARMTRVCLEKGVPFTTESSYTTALMGAQKPTDFLALMDECAGADMGLLFETRDALSLKYRPLAELHNDNAVLTLDYAAKQVAPPFEPVRDDQRIRNAVTAKRADGGEATVEQTVGRYSVSDPAAGGVGRYDNTTTVNVRSDNQLGDTAGWHVHLGTWDEPRAPTVTVFLDAISDTLADAVLAADIGDRIDITNLQALGIYDTVSLLVLGYVESWDSATHKITFNCVPQKPYRVLKLETPGLAKLDSLGTTLSAGISSSATTTNMTLAPGEPYWTTDAGQMPIPIKFGGEVAEITASTTGFALVGVGAATHAVNASVTPGFPSGTHVPGHLMCVLAAIRNSGVGVPVQPAGWITLASSGNLALFGKAYEVGDVAPLITFTGGVALADTSAQMATFRGALPEVYASAVQLNGSAQDVNTPSVSLPSATNLAMVLYIGWKQDDWTSVDTMVSSTEIGEPSTVTGDDQGIVWDYRVVAVEFDTLSSRTFIVTGGAAAISRGMTVCFVNRAQTFTLTRSMNGVVKTHPAGTQIQLNRAATLAHAKNP